MLSGAPMRAPDPDRFFLGPQRELARAIAAADLAAVRALAPATDLNTPGAEDMTLLVFAMHRASGEEPARLQIVTELVRAGADVHHVVPLLSSALDMAILAKSPAHLRAMLDGGVSPDARVGRGHTPALFHAASEATVESMRLLLDRGADVNARDSIGTPAITYALRALQLDQVEELLDRGADPRSVNRLGQSFARVLEELMARQLPGSPALRKMAAIRDRIVRAGVKWPPDAPEVERERMRQRGEEPIVPVGQAR
ncbi:ankyrin repeat domain-containing protein [Sorangium sp. So ce513]|uniref:ankyrin repeat domain-containing protein n=2 Tax=unclassified Sorangium TaxID=2621164 RepID=UPI003F61AA0C